MKSDNEDDEKISVKINRATRKKAKVIAAMQGMTMEQVITKAIETLYQESKTDGL